MIGLSVRDHGAKGDGVADDTAAIQACIDAAPEGDVVTFPRGRYRTTKTITINKTLSLIGSAAYAQFVGFFGDASYAGAIEWGSVIECHARSGAAFEHDPKRYTGLRLEHLVVKGVGDASRTTAGFRIAFEGGTVEVEMTGVCISNFKVGIDLDWIQNSRFDHIRVNGCDTGVHCRVNTNGNVFTGLLTSGCGDAVVAESAVCNLFQGGSIQGSQRNGVVLRKGSDENTIKGIYFENPRAEYAVRVEGSGAASIETCHFGADGDNVLLAGNWCRLMGGKYARDVTITGYGTTIVGQGPAATLRDSRSGGPPTVVVGGRDCCIDAGLVRTASVESRVLDLGPNGTLRFDDGRRWAPDGLFVGAGREWTADGLYPGGGIKWAGFGAIGPSPGEGLRFVGWTIDRDGTRRQGWIVPPLRNK